MKARVEPRLALELLLWAGAASTLAIAVVGATWAPKTDASPTKGARTAMTAPVTDASALARLRDRVIAGDPFRLLRRASPVAFALAMPEQGMGMTMPMRPTKPVLVLRGVVGGPPWEAVLDGVPGRERGVVVRAGDVLGGTAESSALRVRQVGAGGVVITGMDTTWRLNVGGDAAARRAP